MSEKGSMCSVRCLQWRGKQRYGSNAEATDQFLCESPFSGPGPNIFIMRCLSFPLGHCRVRAGQVRALPVRNPALTMRYPLTRKRWASPQRQYIVRTKRSLADMMSENGGPTPVNGCLHVPCIIDGSATCHDPVLGIF